MTNKEEKTKDYFSDCVLENGVVSKQYNLGLLFLIELVKFLRIEGLSLIMYGTSMDNGQ